MSEITFRVFESVYFINAQGSNNNNIIIFIRLCKRKIIHIVIYVNIRTCKSYVVISLISKLHQQKYHRERMNDICKDFINKLFI